jgi:hypothetical protein
MPNSPDLEEYIKKNEKSDKKREEHRNDTHRKKTKNKKKTYNSRYSLVVTDPTTNRPLLSLSTGERTGSGVL